ncbi:MAG: 3-hydroxyacyl-CoA dehydrogenase family protein [Bacteroidales bacterium]|jgi:3-hydroxybutyryl-CoA dehydrogenase|nr:3-hydroxyacyl-CoA dehydrogenase family protein [Bacteroidales bacterium]MDD4213477.1 3-hydroxyacyl-CoA dehydrogenase family protein [Bacteroidales bacterium]
MGSEKTINRIGIIGSGKMGTDILHFLLFQNYKITQICLNIEEAERSRQLLNKKLLRLQRCEAINEEQFVNTISSVDINNEYKSLESCDLIIECTWENPDRKKKLMNDIASYLQTEAVIASNSSSIKPSLFVNKTLSDKTLGLHFFYPVKLKNIVEIIVSKETSDDAKNMIVAFCKKIGKRHLMLDEENAFILNKLFLEVQNEAFNIHIESNLSYKQIDDVVKENLFPDGIFSFFDQVGNDIMLASIMNYISDISDSERYHPLVHKLEEMCRNNQLGVKTKSGFYPYLDIENQVINKNVTTTNEIITGNIISRLCNIYFKEAHRIIAKGICSPDDLEFAVKEYMNIDKGPFTLEQELKK